VSLWILTLSEYSIAYNDVYHRIVPAGSSDWTGWHRAGSNHSVYLAASMALVPMVFLTISVSNSLPRLRDLWIAVSAALTVTTILFARWLGLGESWIDTHIDALFGQDNTANTARANRFFSELADRHEAYWPWLLLALILTTVFVIFGAWRRQWHQRSVRREIADDARSDSLGFGGEADDSRADHSAPIL
jgi:hypothetical protein